MIKEKIDKIINSKVSWIIIGSLILILLIILIIPKRKEPNIPIIPNPGEVETKKEYTFNLEGEEEITLYLGSEYIEPGYFVIDENGDDFSNLVSVSGNVNTNKVGEYELTYTFITENNKEMTLKRLIKIIEKDYSDLTLKLNGSEYISIPLNYDYEELGAVAYLDDVDLSDEIKITSNFDKSKVGVYNVVYQIKKGDIKKEVTRKVEVYNLDNLFKYNKTKTKNNVTITVDNKYFKQVTLPSNIVSQEKIITYQVSKNGTYKFTMYDNNGKTYTKTITINNIDTTPPKGTCKAVLLDGKTTFTITSTDTDIKEYIYNDGYKSTTNTYVVNKFIRESKATLVDDVFNQNNITCETEIQTLPVITPKKGETVKYTAKSDSLVVYVTKNNGYYLTRIWAKDPVYQMKKELVSGSSFKRPKVILEQAVTKYNLKNKIVLGSNASPPIKVNSYYDKLATDKKVYNLKEPLPLLIYNGKVIINDPEETRGAPVIYYIDSSNQLKYVSGVRSKTTEQRKKIYEDIIASGAYNTFTFRPALVNNYKALEAKVDGDYNALRQGFCQVDSNNFILVSSDTKRWYLPNFAKFMQSIGCKTAINFDGGGSTATFYKPSGTNTIKTLTGNERSLSSVMYFTELD